MIKQCIALLLGVTLLSACEPLENWWRGEVKFNAMNVTGMNIGEGLHLLDADGQPRTIKDFAGKAVLLYFGFTQCPSVCPTELARAANARKLLGKDAEKFQVLFITVDPERDTPEVIKAYTKAFDPSFLGLYGSLAQTQKSAADFHVFFAKVPLGDTYTIDHTVSSFLFDPQGRLRLLVLPDITAEQLAADVLTLIQSPNLPTKEAS